MKILITGAKGFLGSSLFHLLSFHNEVYSLGRTCCDYNVDLANEITKINQNFDLVIHAAGRAHLLSKSKIEQKQFHLDNFEATKNLLASFNKQNRPKYFLFISSVSVYGLDSGTMIDENTEPNPKDLYGISKLKCENLVKDWCVNMDIICTIFRLPLVVGINPKGNLMSMINAIKKGFYFNINKGEARRSMVLSTDIAKFIPSAILIGGTYNLTDGIHPSYSEISNVIARHFNKKKIYSFPYSFAVILISLFRPFNSILPFNKSHLKKMVSTLTFSDQKARDNFNWSPTSVIKGFRLD